MARFIYFTWRIDAAERQHRQPGHGQGWTYCFGDSPQELQTMNTVSSTGLENSFYLLICTCTHWWGACVTYFMHRECKPCCTMSMRKDTHTLNFQSMSLSCLLNWPSVIPSPGLLIPPVVPEKTKDILVPRSSGGIKSLHNVYLDSKQATDSACHQEFEGFNLPGISTEINTILWQKIIVHPFSVALKCSLSYHHPE